MRDIYTVVNRHLQTDRAHWIMNSLREVEMDASGESLKVNCTSLDEIMSREELKQGDLLKLDCEGSEHEVLQECAPEFRLV